MRIACNRATIVFPAGVVAAPTLRVYAGLRELEKRSVKCDRTL